MCAGAIMHARVPRLVFGARDPKAGAAGGIMQVINHPRLNHHVRLPKACWRAAAWIFCRRSSESAEARRRGSSSMAMLRVLFDFVADT